MSYPRIRIIIGSLEVGGAELHLAQVLPSLAEKGWKITLLVLSDKLTLKNRLQHPNISIESISPTQGNFFMGRILVKCIKIFFLLRNSFLKDTSSITHFFLPESYFIGMLLAKFYRLKSPLIMSRRSLNHYQKKHKILGYLEPFLHKFCTLILVNSHAIKNQLILEEKVPKEKITVIHNGIKEDRFLTPTNDSQLLQDLNIPPHAFIMAVTANLIPYKGHADLLEALGVIKNQLGSDWVLIIIGQDRGQLTSLQSQAKKLEIEHHIRWIQSSQEPLPYLSLADVGILPSHEEGFSNAILEMMGAGLPVIATNVGGNTEAIIHNETGILAPPKNPEALGDAILSLFRDPQKRLSLGRAGKIRFQKYFTLPTCVHQYENAYRLLKKKNPL